MKLKKDNKKLKKLKKIKKFMELKYHSRNSSLMNSSSI